MNDCEQFQFVLCHVSVVLSNHMFSNVENDLSMSIKKTHSVYVNINCLL